MLIRPELLEATAAVLRRNGIEPDSPAFQRQDVQEAAAALLVEKGIGADAAVAAVLALANG